MALTRTVREIGGVRYALQTVPALAGRKLYFRLLQIVGPAATRALRSGVVSLKSFLGPNSKANMAAAALAADAFEELFARLSEADLELFVHTFADHTFVLCADGSELPLSKTIDTFAFAGRPGLLVQWLRASMEHSLSGFLADSGITFPQSSATPEAAASPSPTV